MTTEVSSIPEVTSPPLIDHGNEISTKLVPVDAHVRCRQRGDFGPGDEGATTGPNGSQLRDGFTIASDDERFAGGNSVDHARVVAAQHTLVNALRHTRH